jgi:hypothetical protein
VVLAEDLHCQPDAALKVGLHRSSIRGGHVHVAARKEGAPSPPRTEHSGNTEHRLAARTRGTARELPQGRNKSAGRTAADTRDS